MSWFDAAPESTHRPARFSRPLYVPPHRVNNGFPAPDESTHYGFNDYGSVPRGRGRGRGDGRGYGRGRGRGRGPGFSRPEEERERNNRIPLDGFEVAGETESDGVINFDAYESVPVEASGQDVPPPVIGFAEADLDEDLKKNIERCKYVKPTPIQRHAIPIAVAGRDLMACAQTGSGKTAAFCFPIISGILKGRSASAVSSMSRGAIVAYPTALILSPTRELSCQIHEEVRKFAYKTGVKVVVAYGGSPIFQQLRNLEKGVDILVATPGRLVDIIEREKVSLTRIKYLALDEADRMLDMGFERQIRKIVEQMHMPSPGVRQTMLFSATFPNDIQKLAADFLSNYIFLTVGKVGSSTELIVQKVELVQDTDKRNHLRHLLSCQTARGANRKYALTLVFVETKRGADDLENWLSINGFPAIAIHGDKAQMERERALRSFKCGSTPIMVATDVASRGLDIPHVAHVINFDLPRDIADYVHRIGRTGRAGKSGLATAFFGNKNIPLAKSLVELLQEAKQEVPSWLYQYADSSSRGSSYTGRRYSRGAYGGRDIRNFTEPVDEHYSYSGSYGNVPEPVGEDYNYCGSNRNADHAADTYSSTYFDNKNKSDSSFDVTNTVTADLYGAVKVEDGPCGYASVVPSGWD